MDRQSVTRAALDLFGRGRYPSVVTLCEDVLEEEPESAPLRLLCARAYLALRRDAEAQQQVRECLRHDLQSAPAYRLLGEIALRRDAVTAAETFFREAERLDPGNRETLDWLDVCHRKHQAVTETNLPAVAAEATAEPDAPPAAASKPEAPAAPLRARRHERRLAVGTEGGRGTVRQLPQTPGFGQYLVQAGILAPVQLKAALVYQSSTGVRFGRAAVVLGFVSESKLEWAALAFHAHRKAAD